MGPMFRTRARQHVLAVFDATREVILPRDVRQCEWVIRLCVAAMLATASACFYRLLKVSPRVQGIGYKV